jgi:hypothetical protein
MPSGCEKAGSVRTLGFLDNRCALCGPLRLCAEYLVLLLQYAAQRRKGPQSTRRKAEDLLPCHVDLRPKVEVR